MPKVPGLLAFLLFNPQFKEYIMAVRSFMTIVAAHAAAQAHISALNQREPVVQGREHAPPAPSFNGRGKLDPVVDPAPSVLYTHPELVGKIADLLVVRGHITPHQRYEIAMQRDIG